MEFSINALLTNFADDKLVAPKVLEKKLDCDSDTSLQQLQIVLDALEKVGILTKERGKYRRLPEEGLVEGKLRCSSKGFCFAIQDVEGSEDIYIRESQLSSAWNGDRVLVRVTKEGRRRRSPEGEVRLILERANPSVIARVKKTDEGGYRAVPLDDRLLFELDLEPTPAVPALEPAVDQLVHVEIARYPLGPLPPVGQVKQILGSNAESAAEVDLVCCKYDLPQDFSEAAQQAVAALPVKVRKADMQKRLDLRDRPTVTIAQSLTDLLQDHALSIEQTGPDQWRLGVHSVDVAAYVLPDSPLDRQALKRGTYLNLEDKVLPLFPPTFCRGLGALAPEQDRLAVSVLITLNAAGEVLEFEIQPTVIRVDQALTEVQAQAVAARSSGEPADLQGLESVFELIDQLQSLGVALQQQRHQRGAFDQILPAQNSSIYPDQGLQGAVVVAPPWTLRTWVSEGLVLANQLVVSHLQALELPVAYQAQPLPDVYEVQALLKLANNLGLELSLSLEDQVQPQDYQHFVQQLTTTEVAPILLKLLHNTLKPVSYSLTPAPHFGLALQGYGQAALPLRRYADLLNQRVLHAIFAEGRDRRTTRTKERVNLRHSSCHGQINWNVLPPELHRDLESAITTAVPQLNERDKILQQAYSDLEGLQKAKQMQVRTGEIFRGLITRIESYGFFVVIEDPMVDGLVHVSSLKDDWYEYRSRQQTLIGRKNRKQYRLGDRVEVQVKSVDYYRQQIDLLVVGGGSEATGDDMEEPEDLERPEEESDFEDEE